MRIFALMAAFLLSICPAFADEAGYSKQCACRLSSGYFDHQPFMSYPEEPNQPIIWEDFCNPLWNVDRLDHDVVDHLKRHFSTWQPMFEEPKPIIGVSAPPFLMFRGTDDECYFLPDGSKVYTRMQSPFVIIEPINP